jgi:Kdo2-lipid IVA lauroyltransferase/acyltransferase
LASPRLRAFRGRVVYVAVSALGLLFRLLPLSVARAIGVAIAIAAAPFLRRERLRADANLTIAYPEWTRRQRRATIRALTRHMGANFAEFLWMPKVDLASTTTYEGKEFITERKGGMIAITAHSGNWEWAARAIGAIAPVTTMQRARDEEHINRLIVEMRAKSNVRSIDRGSAAGSREMIRTLRDGHLLGFLIDQNIRAESVKVPFFGKPALTPIGPARLAIRAGVPVVLIFDERAGGKHIVRILPPIETTKDDDPVALTARITAIIEEQIRRKPEQWVWFHDRWRERPKWDVTPTEGTG